MDIGKNLAGIKATLPEGVKLVAVSKTKPPGFILKAREAGQNIFGENKVQELVRKYEELPQDIEWHFIGHLQSNKAKYIVPFVDLVHSIDSFKILKILNKEAGKIDRIIPCLLQFHIAEEASKFGLSEKEARAIIESEEFKEMKHVTIAGVMGMATFTEDEKIVRREFKTLRGLFETLKSSYFHDDPEFKEVSMGMSADYRMAIEEGSTLVRIGSTIFGER